MLKKLFKHKVLTVFLIIIILIIAAKFIYNFGWRLWGFSSCVSPEYYMTLKYEINQNSVDILYDKGYNKTRTLGYITTEKDGVLRIGIKYYEDDTGLFFDRGNSVDKLTIPFTDKPSKIILCGDGHEIDIKDHINEEAYESIKDLITIW